jgi:hypothetical protein
VIDLVNLNDNCLLKGFYPYLNFYLSSWKGSVVFEVIYVKKYVIMRERDFSKSQIPDVLGE